MKGVSSDRLVNSGDCYILSFRLIRSSILLSSCSPDLLFPVFDDWSPPTKVFVAFNMVLSGFRFLQLRLCWHVIIGFAADRSACLTVFRAITEALGEGELRINSTKSMTGHLLGAAAAVEAIAAVKAILTGASSDSCQTALR